MTTFTFETMFASEAATFTSADRLTFSSQFTNAGDINVSSSGSTTSLTLGRTLTFDSAALAAAPVTFAATSSNPDGVLVLGTAGSDSLTVPNNLFGNAVHGLAGNDSITDGAMYGIIYGGAGSDTIIGNGGGDSIRGGSQADSIGDGADSIVGGAGSNHLFGDLGNDTLSGGDGFDYLDGGPGDDRMIGGLTSDHYIVDSAGDQVIENPGEGSDLVEIFSTTFSIEAFSSIEDLTVARIGGATVTGNDENNFINGDANDPTGNDVFNGLQGNDTLLGRLGDDLLNGGAGNDSISGGPNTGSPFANGNDTMNGGDGDDIFDVGTNPGADVYNGGNGNDIIRGDGQSSFLDLSTSRFDSIERLETGSRASDFLSFIMSYDQANSLPSTMTLVGGAGRDHLVVQASAAGSYQLAIPSLSNWTANGANGDTIGLTGTRAVNYILLAPAQHDDVVVRLFGNVGNDQLIGGSGIDLISANNGDDTIDGGQGDDQISGDAGHDVLNGGDNADSLTGGNGNDHIYGQSANGGPDGADTIDAGAGSDYLQGNAGNDSLDGGSGSDRINGGASDDSIVGSAGNDSINGNLGNDSIDGGDDNDSMRGGQGNDTIAGGNGNDLLLGDLGSDRLTGGAGADIFTFSGQGSLATAPDSITDFTAGTDRLALGFTPAALLTGTTQTTLAAAQTAAQQLADGHAGTREVAIFAVGSDSYVFYSSSGGATLDSAVLLAGISSSALALSDFG